MRTERRTVKQLLAAVLTCIGAVVIPMPALAGAEGHAGCGVPRLAIVIDDKVNVAAPVSELARRAQLASSSLVLQAALTPNPCLEFLDNDPLFWALPGAAQPDVILRVRLDELAMAERSLGDKAGNAVGRYIGSYLGSNTEDVVQLKRVGIAVDVLCSKSRRKAITLTGQSGEAPTALPDQNSQLLQAAAQTAVQEINAFLAANPQACTGAPMANAPPNVPVSKKPD